MGVLSTVNEEAATGVFDRVALCTWGRIAPVGPMIQTTPALQVSLVGIDGGEEHRLRAESLCAGPFTLRDSSSHHQALQSRTWPRAWKGENTSRENRRGRHRYRYTRQAPFRRVPATVPRAYSTVKLDEYLITGRRKVGEFHPGLKVSRKTVILEDRRRRRRYLVELAELKHTTWSLALCFLEKFIQRIANQLGVAANRLYA